LRPKIPVKLKDIIDSEKRKTWRMDKGMMVFSLYDPKTFFLIDILQRSFDLMQYTNREKK